MGDRPSEFPDFFSLPYEPAFESLGEEYFDPVTPADFPQHLLRFRNDRLLSHLGLDPETILDSHFIDTFGRFNGPQPCLAMRYHGRQFGEYNPFLGDGRGFLYGQVRGLDGELYDFGTKGSGQTPYSRSADGRLTLKGGVREVIAGEALQALGVRTSRCLSLIETGESLWRGDEPSPTRSSVMVRFSRSHIRFGTFERLHYLKRRDLIPPLLDHVIAYYYPHLLLEGDRPARFFAELVKRVASLVAQWMAVGFCHGVLNTDNMSITGESFDYGPYGFISSYSPRFIAAYFDYGGRYSFGNQPMICRWNLEMLQESLSAVIPVADLVAGLALFETHYSTAYRHLMGQKLGFGKPENPDNPDLDEQLENLVTVTVKLLLITEIDYQEFFQYLSREFSPAWRENVQAILPSPECITPFVTPWAKQFTMPFVTNDEQRACLEQWRSHYHQLLNQFPAEEMPQIAQRLRHYNPPAMVLRPEIEALWEPIVLADDWEPFNALVQRLQHLQHPTHFPSVPGTTLE